MNAGNKTQKYFLLSQFYCEFTDAGRNIQKGFSLKSECQLALGILMILNSTIFFFINLVSGYRFSKIRI